MTPHGYIGTGPTDRSIAWLSGRELGATVAMNIIATPVLLALAKFGGEMGMTDFWREMTLFGAIYCAAAVSFDRLCWYIVASEWKEGRSCSQDDNTWGLARLLNVLPWWVAMMAAMATVTVYLFNAAKAGLGIG